MLAEEFARRIVSVLGLPETHLRPYTGHNLSVVLTFVQVASGLGRDFGTDIKRLGPIALEASKALLKHGLSGRNAVAAIDFSRRGVVPLDAMVLDLAPGPTGLVLVPKGTYGAVGAPMEVMEVVVAFAHTDNAVKTSVNLCDQASSSSPGREVKPGEKVSINEVVSQWMNVDHIFEGNKLWWAGAGRFDVFSKEACMALGEDDLEAALVKLTKIMANFNLKQMTSEARQGIECVARDLARALMPVEVAAQDLIDAEIERKRLDESEDD